MAETTKERLLVNLTEAQSDAVKTDEQIERQKALIGDLQSTGADTINAMAALSALEAIRDLHYNRVEMILNQLDLNK